MQNQHFKHEGPILILPDIRSVLNVGSLFRTADAIGISKIYMTGYTPTPFDRFGRKRSDFVKTALGAEDEVSWEYKKTILPLLKNLKKEGYLLIAVEQDNNSIDYKKLKIKDDKIALILGNEVTGLSKSVLKMVDHIIEIPMNGKKESLNVSVAGAIVMYRLLDK